MRRPRDAVEQAVHVGILNGDRSGHAYYTGLAAQKAAQPEWEKALEKLQEGGRRRCSGKESGSTGKSKA